MSWQSFFEPRKLKTKTKRESPARIQYAWVRSKGSAKWFKITIRLMTITEAFFQRRQKPVAPTSPIANNTTEPGSGTAPAP